MKTPTINSPKLLVAWRATLRRGRNLFGTRRSASLQSTVLAHCHSLLAVVVYSFIIVAASAAWAQEATPPPTIPPLPPGPLLKRAPDFSQWGITYDSPADKAAGHGSAPGKSEAAKPKALKEVQVTKSGSVRRVVTVEPDGSRSEVWCKDSVQALVRPEWKYPVLADNGNKDNPNNSWILDFSKTDFPGCEWVSAGTYKGIQKLNGRECIVFQGQMVAATEDAPAHPASSEDKNSGAPQFAVSAYIDIETRFPVRVLSGGEIANYKFGPVLQAMLEIPANIREAIEARDKTRKIAASMPPTPFGTPASPPPSGPLPKRAPDFSQWVATYSNVPASPRKQGGTPGQESSSTGSNASKPVVTKRVEVTKTGQLRHLVTVEPDGSRSELWFNGDMEVVCLEGWKFPWITQARDPRNPFAMNFSKTDFPEFGWVSAKNYVGIQQLGGRECLVFGECLPIEEEEVESASATPGNSGAVPRARNMRSSTAYIDRETRLPVMLVRNGDIVAFQFGPTPQAMLVFPANIRAAIEAQAKEIKHLTSMPPRPY